MNPNTIPRSTFTLEVNASLPPRLARLEELAANLWYSWNRATRTLFSHLDPELWREVGHNPRIFLKRVAAQRLSDAAADPIFLGNFDRVLSAFDTYLDAPLRRDPLQAMDQTDLIAYFCAEFGFHESLPIYSGGLGILAGDHCKTASDMCLPFVAVGLLYRQGYFHQTIDTEGNQRALHADSDFDDLPVAPVLRDDGSAVCVSVDLPGRSVQVKVWRAHVGHCALYLLDTDIPENTDADRYITHRLYGGDRSTRIAQEMILGIGGVRALRELGLQPTVWHINEGHAAFLILERVRALVGEGLSFEAAMEAVAAHTVFTTHTPVPAGHDHFSAEMIENYLGQLRESLGLSKEQFFALGHVDNGEFNMTALAIRGSRFQNGVSRIHGGVSSRICATLWPEVDAEHNPIAYVTNGVHVPTFLAPEWSDQFDQHLGCEWPQNIGDPAFWQRLEDMPNHLFWSVRQALKAQMLTLVRKRLSRQHFRNRGSEAHLDRLLRFADPVHPNVLTVGFARRFATYKRATLLFEDLNWLREILGDAQRPVLFLFAGKAHPADVPGQDLIRQLHQTASLPEFEGKILLIEDYDLRLARHLVSGVDVWLNNPVYPLEASGTSGMKAGINGVLNLSVLDGWWDEGYDGSNGWAIKPAAEHFDTARRNFEESRTLYELLQDHVIPMYYSRADTGYSAEWIRMSKRSIATLLPRFSSTRMIGEYLARLYEPASRQGRRIHGSGYEPASRLAEWKAHIRKAWPGMRLRRLDAPKKRIAFGESVRFEVAVALGALRPQDIALEMLMIRGAGDNNSEPGSVFKFVVDSGHSDKNEQHYVLDLSPELCGKLEYRIRAYPHHELLTHPFEMGMMRWL